MKTDPTNTGIIRFAANLKVLLVALVCLGYNSVSLGQGEMVASKRECANCHISELSDFKQNQVMTLIPYDPEPVTDIGQQKVESTERMCFSCHDGFLQDTRHLWSHRKNSHPVGVKPSENVSIPVVDGKPVLPLNKAGNMYCGTCHFAHGVDWGHHDEEFSPTIFLRVVNLESSLCVSCHEERSTGPKDGNHPIHKHIDTIPEELVEAGSKFGDDQTLICQSCHTPHGAPDERLLVVENPDSHLCGDCHEKRYAHNPVEAARFGTHPVNILPTNAKMSEELLEAGGKLAPDGRVICQSCHKQHLAVAGTNLLVQDNQESALCKNCHSKEFSIANTKHDMNLTDPDLLNQRRQTVSQRGVCSSCHMTHGGMGPKMWARDIFTLDDPMSHTCMGCHSDNGLSSEYLIGEHSHPVGVEMAASGTDRDGLPLYTLEGVKITNGEKGFVACASCHDPHQWDPLDPSNTAKPGEQGNDTNRFLRKAVVTNPAGCTSCHQDKGAIAGTEHDMSIIAPKEKNVREFTAETGGICSSCHLPHSGTGAVMWSRDEIRGEGIKGLCLDCHREQGLAKDKLIGDHDHPNLIQVELPNIDQDLPLFNAQGERDPSGRIDCATCHDLHRWNPQELPDPGESLIEVEGDATDSFLRRAAADGEASLCVACHRNKEWVVGTDHDLALTAPGNLNDAGQNVQQSGICGQCHASHNSNSSLVLWALTPGAGQDDMETLCRSCHMPDKNAETKVPSTIVHPPAIMRIIAGHLSEIRNGTPDKPNLPVYSEDGQESHFGLITCPTCHDPHQWNSLKKERGPAELVDGNVLNSFLRISETRSFYCAACHGEDSLFRYKFFHWEKYKSHSPPS